MARLTGREDKSVVRTQKAGRRRAAFLSEEKPQRGAVDVVPPLGQLYAMMIDRRVDNQDDEWTMGWRALQGVRFGGFVQGSRLGHVAVMRAVTTKMKQLERRG